MMRMPLKSCLKKTCLPDVVPAAVPVPPVAPVSIYQTPAAAAPPSKRFDVTTILLVIVVVGLVFGCILIFLLFRLRRMELQLQQTTKNFNMQTVRELIAQEIQDTVEQLEEQMMFDAVQDLEELPPLQVHKAPSHQSKDQQHQGHFFVPLPNMQELNQMFESLVSITEVVPPPVVRSADYEHKIEEILEPAEVPQQQEEKSEVCLENPQFAEVSKVHEEVPRVSEESSIINETSSPAVHEVCMASEAPSEVTEVCMASEAPSEVTEVCMASEAPSEVHEVCMASEAPVVQNVPETVAEQESATVTDNMSEASSVAGSPKVPSKRTRRTPAPRGKRKKTEDVPSVDISDL